jgi:hypothetical protein
LRSLLNALQRTVRVGRFTGCRPPGAPHFCVCCVCLSFCLCCLSLSVVPASHGAVATSVLGLRGWVEGGGASVACSSATLLCALPCWAVVASMPLLPSSTLSPFPLSLPSVLPPLSVCTVGGVAGGGGRGGGGMNNEQGSSSHTNAEMEKHKIKEQQRRAKKRLLLSTLQSMVLGYALTPLRPLPPFRPVPPLRPPPLSAPPCAPLLSVPWGGLVLLSS